MSGFFRMQIWGWYGAVRAWGRGRGLCLIMLPDHDFLHKKLCDVRFVTNEWKLCDLSGKRSFNIYMYEI